MTYKLTYFDARGAAEVARQLFALAGKEYEDHRVSHEEFPAIKNDMPFLQVPVLEVDGKQIPQTYAIFRYLAKKFGFAGKCDFEQAQVDAVADQIKDFMNDIRPFYYAKLGFNPGADVEKLKTEMFEPAVEKHMALITKMLKKNPSGFLVGENVTWADLLLSENIHHILANFADLSAWPEIKAHNEKIHAIPAIKEWIAKRPVTQH